MKQFLASMGLLISLLIPALAFADFDEGIEYRLLSNQPPVAGDKPIEVTEFFWYGCPHCFQFEPYIKKWLETKPDGVKFVKVPATFNKPAKFHAYVFYALDLMGEADRTTDIIFEAMHKQGNRLADQAAVEKLLAQHNVNIDNFRKAMKSFNVDSKVKRATDQFRKYGLRGVPSMAVSGRFVSNEVKNYQELISVTDHMIELAREEQQKSD
jgi:thiol:disulfide interchange protein DsbA